MDAAVLHEFGKSPRYEEFSEPKQMPTARTTRGPANSPLSAAQTALDNSAMAAGSSSVLLDRHTGRWPNARLRSEHSPFPSLKAWMTKPPPLCPIPACPPGSPWLPPKAGTRRKRSHPRRDRSYRQAGCKDSEDARSWAGYCCGTQSTGPEHIARAWC